MVELALTLPLLTFALLGGADLARAFALQIAVENGARAGAESYAIDSTPTTAEAQSAVVNEINRTPTANASASNVTVTKARSDGVTACVSPPTIATVYRSAGKPVPGVTSNRGLLECLKFRIP